MTDTDKAIQAYMDERVDGAKTIADYYQHYADAPAAFIAGAQYALDKILAQSERNYNMPYPAKGIGDVVTVRMLHLMAVDILKKAKRAEPQ
jgi:hypothetical protein